MGVEVLARHCNAIICLKLELTRCLSWPLKRLLHARLNSRQNSKSGLWAAVYSFISSTLCLPISAFLGVCLLFGSLSLLPSNAFAHGETVLVQIDQYEFELELNNSKSAKTFRQALPMQIEMVRWGDQFNGRSPVWIESDASAQMEMEIGDVAFWPPGGCICVFFGPTPHSPGLVPKLSSPGIVLGKLKGNVAVLRNLGGTASVFIQEK